MLSWLSSFCLYLGSGIFTRDLELTTMLYHLFQMGEISSVVLSVPREERAPMCRGIPFYSSHSCGINYYKKTGRFVVLAGLGRISWLFGREFGLHFCLGRFSYLDAESGNL